MEDKEYYGGNGFKEFVRAEINNVKDAAERNYEEHKTLFGHIAEIKERLIHIEAGIANKTSRRALWGTIIGAFILAMASIVTTLIVTLGG